MCKIIIDDFYDVDNMTLSLQYENEDAPCYSFLLCLHAGSIGSGSKYSYHLQLATGCDKRLYRSIRICFCKFMYMDILFFAKSL